MAGRLSSRNALAALCVFVVALGVWNVLHYPPGLGYDAGQGPDGNHLAYADGLVPGWKLPHGIGEYYQP
ncbi:MAG TPA: hypothetical protein VH063_17665, partial [Gaiellaceae bacterium]|nr:hypothetical protein [Gaiellaceae bacterium]